MEEALATGMEGDVGDVAPFLDREHCLRRQGAMVQQTFELGELLFDEAPEAGGDVDVVSAEFESHKTTLS
jgi:hypothetical protein